jgi:catechol 2,3-dioxygenase-like lactoylglutathione lyase family enzyme
VITSILGVDHAGVGVRDAARMRSFYQDCFGFGTVLGEMPEEDHEAIHGLVRSSRAVHSALLLGHEAGGLTLGLFHAIEPVPRPLRTNPRYGDIGVAKLTFSVPDLTAFCQEKGDLLSLFSSPKSIALEGGGEYRFVYGKDPEGNLVEIVSDSSGASSGDSVLRSIGIAVSDLERSLAFYRDVLGFEKIIMAPHESFSGLVDEVTGETGTTVRSCLCASGRGRGMLELFEVTKPRGRSIPFGAQWGDFGYLQVCLYASDRQALIAQVEAAELDMLLPLRGVEDPENPALFMYMRDPDGILVEVMVVGG